MFNYLRSIIFSIVMFTTVIFFSIICLATTILPYHLRYPCLIIWPRLTIWFAKTICGINYVIHGKENIPKEGAIIVANHQSTWETLAFLSFFPHACFVLKKELLNIPIFGWTLGLLNPIAIDRKKGSDALTQVLEQGSHRLANHYCVTIFPEGHRMPVGQLGKFKHGAAKLALRTNVPLVPVSHNAGQFWPRRALLKTPGTIHVHVGTPIAPDNLSVVQLTEKAREVIEQQLRLID